MVGLSPCFVCRGQNWLVYLPMLYVMNKNGWYITRFCLLWTVMVGISPSFFLLWTILVVISTGFVCHGQYWLVNPPVLSVVNNIGCYISLVCVP